MHRFGGVSLLMFGLVAMTVIVGAHYVVYRNLVTVGVPHRILRFSFFLLTIMFPISRAIMYRYSGPLVTLMIWAGSLWLGIVVLLFLTYSASAIVQIAFRSVAPGVVISRKVWTLWVTAGALIVVVGGLINALKAPVIVNHVVDRSTKYGQGKSVRIVHLSDLHLGSQLGESFARQVVAMTNALEPDIIALTGDIMDSEEAAFARVSPVLATLKARVGTYAVSGNHDFYGGIEGFVRHMNAAGIPVLDSEVIMTKAGIQVAGVHDVSLSLRPHGNAISDIDKALKDLDPAAPSIFLIHQPRGLDPAVDKKVDLILAGHTHRGQMFPFSIVVKAMYPLFYGRYLLAPDTEIIVSSGTGFWGPPLRILSQSEIVVIDFRY